MDHYVDPSDTATRGIMTSLFRHDLTELPMTTALSELFDKILYSEQKFHDRISQIKSLNTQTQEEQEKFQLLVEEVESLAKSVETKRKEVFDLQLDLKCSEARQEEMQLQLGRLREEGKRLATKSSETERQRQLERVGFLKEMHNFTHRYDLTGAGKVQRENQAKFRIEVLEKELKSCLDDVEAVSVKQGEVANLKDVIALTEAEIEETSEIEKRVDVEMEEIEREIKRAERHRSVLSNRPQNDHEYQMLHAELEACNDNTMEAMCTALSEELLELQRSQKQRPRRQQGGRSGSKPQAMPPYLQGGSRRRQSTQMHMTPPSLTQTLIGSHSDLLDDIEWASEIDDIEFQASPSTIGQSSLSSMAHNSAESRNCVSANQQVTRQRQLSVNTSSTHRDGAMSSNTRAGMITGSRKRVRFQY